MSRACSKSAKTPEEPATAVADATATLVDWWKLNRYCDEGDGRQVFARYCVHPNLSGVQQIWCSENATDSKGVSELVVKKLVQRDTLSEPAARDRIRELLAG
jgi:hypothetical protein